MLREKIVTIIVGLLVGALVAGGIFFGPNLLSKLQGPQADQASKDSSEKTSPTPAPKIAFELTLPEDNSSTTNSTIKLKGTANPNSKLVVFGNADDKQITADKNGSFEADFKLEEGENELTVTDTSSNPPVSLYRNITLEVTK